MDFHPNVHGNLRRYPPNATTSKEIGLYEGDHGCLIRAALSALFLVGLVALGDMKCCRNVFFSSIARSRISKLTKTCSSPLEF